MNYAVITLIFTILFCGCSGLNKKKDSNFYMDKSFLSRGGEGLAAEFNYTSLNMFGDGDYVIENIAYLPKGFNQNGRFTEENKSLIVRDISIGKYSIKGDEITFYSPRAYSCPEKWDGVDKISTKFRLLNNYIGTNDEDNYIEVDLSVLFPYEHLAFDNSKIRMWSLDEENGSVKSELLSTFFVPNHKIEGVEELSFIVGCVTRNDEGSYYYPTTLEEEFFHN